MYMKAKMLKNVYEGLNARPKVYLSKEYFCEMYLTCVSSKLCEFIFLYKVSFEEHPTVHIVRFRVLHHLLCPVQYTLCTMTCQPLVIDYDH